LASSVTFFPQFVLGYLGMPRRYHAYSPEFQVLNVFSSAGASIFAIAYLMSLAYLAFSVLRGAKAPSNPWNALGLEWQIGSPPISRNFLVTPVVAGSPYAYSSIGAKSHDV
jgi:cytochrome c oxidase subunit 1